MLLKLDGEKVTVTIQRNDFRQMLMHCLGQAEDHYNGAHLLQISKALWQYFEAAEKREQLNVKKSDQGFSSFTLHESDG